MRSGIRFDYLLCDVPCSGFGVLDNRPDIKLFRQKSAGDWNSVIDEVKEIVSRAANKNK